MTKPADARLPRAVEMRLRHRLEDFSRDLEGCVTGGGEAAQEGFSADSGFLARDALAGRLSALIEQHADLALADIAAFLARAADGALRPWFDAQLDAHLDRIVSRTLAAVGTGSGRGLAPAAAMRNRFANLAAAIKTRARASLEAAPVQTEGVDSTGGEAQELDDRLPLHRRRVFDRDLQQLVEQSASAGQPMALMMIDLDLFKRVNDEHGHPVGDEVLLTVSERVIRRLGRKGRAYRYGGEELALLLPGYSWEEAFGLAERIRKDIAAAPVTGKSIAVTASLGVASFPDHAGDGTALLRSADQALYEAKHAGRNCSRVASEVPTADPPSS